MEVLPKDDVATLEENNGKFIDGIVPSEVASETEHILIGPSKLDIKIPKDGLEISPDILYEVRYTNSANEQIYSRTLPRPAAEIESPPGSRPPVMKVVETRTTWLEAGAPELVIKDIKPRPETIAISPVGSLTEKELVIEDAEKKQVGEHEWIKLPPFDYQNKPFIEIMSPAVLEALRSVVEYYPGENLVTRSIRVYWPYPMLTHHDEALEQYQKKFEEPNCTKPDCSGQYASEHIGIIREFVHKSTGVSIAEELKRHERGFASFEMLWLLYKPGDDVLWDRFTYGEYEPWVIRTIDWVVTDGTIQSYSITLWNMNVDSVFIGPCNTTFFISPFSGEREISSLRMFPFNCLKKDNKGRSPEEVKNSLIERGKVFFKLRTKGCWDFRGHTTFFPRHSFEGLVMMDPIQYFTDNDRERNILDSNFESDNARLVDHDCCNECRVTIASQTRPFKFSGYSKINPQTEEGLTDHQYFLCDRSVDAFAFKHRGWRCLDVSGIKPVRFDQKMLDTLVLEPHIKKMIQSLTKQYIKGLEADQARQRSLNDTQQSVDPVEPGDSSWSADFIKGKGEGLIFLLHGKPGVGKTYTAECIAANAKRPLLTLTCADIGTNPVEIEMTLLRWFKLATSWNAIMLIDEADIYMEHRKVQDLERNNLVAGFLRAMEYYKGILFLTTNRVGTFDEAFISRINLTIYYPPFSPNARKEVWESFFSKLEREKEDKMRIHNNTRDYVEEAEVLEQLQWNGREIRNAFQIAVALAEAEGEKDARGRVVINKDHIRATVEMSKAFKHYMKKVNKKDEDAMAAARGNRYDSVVPENSEQTVFR